MARNAFRTVKSPALLAVMELLMALKALPFLGTRYICPCCGWFLRDFTHGGASMRARVNGYCPRCNAKARHRRNWLFLQANTSLFTEKLKLLHISPKYALSRRFTKMSNLEYVAFDIEGRPNTTLRADVTTIPLKSAEFDAIICIHVLEHVSDDRAAIAEMYRVLRPGGWALISVPMRLDRPTYEDPSITIPAERKVAFGELSHVRWYGRDFVDRLEAAGFEVTTDAADDLDPELVARYGLLRDENVFLCIRPQVMPSAR